MKISSIGYKTKYVTVKALLKNSTVYLEPETELLDEVVVTAKGADAKEILQEVIKRIPDNYLQTPFNMEFYSINTSIDTTSNKSFTLESVFMSYYEGYTLGANKAYRILHKRETDEYFMREKTHGMSQWPIWEVAYNDLYSNQVEKAVMTTEALSKIKPRFVGTQLFDGDTVFIIQYTYRVSGTLYVSSKDYAILKHVTLASGKGHVNRVELIYRKQNGKYFPYLANGDYRHEYKVDGTKKMLKITNRAVLNKIDVDNVKTIGHDQQVWIPKDVFYDKEYWDNNYPVER